MFLQVLMFQKSKDSHNRVAKFNSSISVDHAHFQITIETSPNKGLYESTVQVFPYIFINFPLCHRILKKNEYPERGTNL